MHPQNDVFNSAWRSVLNEQSLFHRKSPLPYYGSDMLGKFHQEHMKWRTFKPYASQFESIIDSTGNHIEAHRAGMEAVENHKKRNPFVDIEPKLINKF